MKVKDCIPEGWLAHAIPEVLDQVCAVEPVRAKIGDVEVMLKKPSLKILEKIDSLYPFKNLVGDEYEEEHGRWSFERVMSAIVAWYHPVLAENDIHPCYDSLRELELTSAAVLITEVSKLLAQLGEEMLKKDLSACFRLNESEPIKQDESASLEKTEIQ